MHSVDVKALKERAAHLKPLFLQYYKKNKKKLEKSDYLVHNIHSRVVEEIDCISCANCCKTLGPSITLKDIDKIAKALKVKPSQVVDDYLKIDEDGDYVFRTMPCPFLLDDNYCSIYEHRPKACREYPHTDRKRFVQIYKLTVLNSSTCPIALQVLEKLLEQK